MDREQYVKLQNEILVLGGVVRGMDLQGFIQAIDVADEVGPLADPALWRSARPRMMQIRELAVALGEFQQAVRRFTAAQDEPSQEWGRVREAVRQAAERAGDG